MAEFKVPNPKGVSGKVLGLGLLGGLGLITYSKILPWLNGIVWGTVELAVGAAVAGILGFILLSPKFWKRTRIVLEALGSLLFGWFVEMNKWNILEMQLDKAEDNRKEVFEANKRLQAQESSLTTQLNENEILMKQSAEELKICQRKLIANPADEETQMLMETSTVAFNNAKDFIDGVAPIRDDIKKLVVYTDKAYRKSGNALKNARMTLKMQRAKYDAMEAGSSAMTKALRAFTGDSEMNKAGDIAMRKIEQDIANMAGTIRTTIQATSAIMNERDLRDAAKVALAASQVEQLNIDSTFDYIQSVDLPGKIPTDINIKPNKYLDTLK